MTNPLLFAAITMSLAAACMTEPDPTAPSVAETSGDGASADKVAPSGGVQNTDSIKISKAYTNATATGGGELLIKAASSATTAHLFAYRPDGSLIGEVQNGGGSRYGGTVMPYQSYDPITVTIKSSDGGTASAPTTPFQI